MTTPVGVATRARTLAARLAEVGVKPADMDNWDNRRVPSMNTSAERTQASLKRVAGLIAEKNAQFWVNHDKPQSSSEKRSPQFYD